MLRFVFPNGSGNVEAHANIITRDLTNRRTINLFNISDPTALANNIAALGLNLEDFVIRVLQ